MRTTRSVVVGRTVMIGIAGLGTVASGAHAADLHVPDEFSSIQLAIDAAENGDVVIVAPGDYNETICIDFKQVEIRGVLDGATRPRIVGVSGDPQLQVNDTFEMPVVVSNLEFFANPGGGATAVESTVDFVNCLFRFHGALGTTRSALIVASGEYDLEDCEFHANASASYGALSADECDLRMYDCKFTSNDSPQIGAVRVTDSDLFAANCRFTDNSGSSDVGLSLRASTSAYLVGCLLAENESLNGMGDGTATIGLDATSDVSLVNCTVVENETDYGIETGEASWIANSIITAHRVSPLLTGAGSVAIRYSMIEGGAPGPGNIDAAPIFDPPRPYRLAPGTPGIDAADSNELPPKLFHDVEGNSRLINDVEVDDVGVGPSPFLDMGAGERLPRLRYVRAEATGLNNGQSWFDAYTDLQDALDEFGPGSFVDEIWVGRGTYLPDRGTGDRDATFQVPPQLRIYGSFAGSETSVDERMNQSNYLTILSGAIGGPGVEDNSRHVVTCVGAVVGTLLDGMDIRDGIATGALPLDQVGAGLLNMGGSLQVQNCTFRRNGGQGRGFVVYSKDAVATFDGCRVYENGFTVHGSSAFFVEGGSPRLRSTAFYANRTGDNGTLVVKDTSSAYLSGLTIAGNRSATGTHAGVLLDDSSGFVFDCLIGPNQSDVIDEPYPVEVDYVSIGSSSINGVAVSLRGWTPGTFASESHCDDDDPMYRDPDGADDTPYTADDNYRLRGNSPAIDSGRSVSPGFYLRDADRNPRFFDDPETPNTGLPASNAVDRGAYEFQGDGCLADLNADGAVGFPDLTLLLNQWGPCGTCSADLNGTGVVDFTDLVLVLGAWGECDGR